MSAGSKRSNEVSNNAPPSKKRKINNDEEEDEFEKLMKQINATASKQKKKAIKKQKEIQSKSEQESIQMNSKKEERIDFHTETPMDAFIEQMGSTDTMFLPTRKGTQGYNSDEEVYNIAKYVNKVNREKKEQQNKFKHKKHNEKDLRYDDYGNIITPDKDRIIEALEAVDHSKIYYKKVNKNFYNEHSDISNMSESQIKEIRKSHKINIKSNNNKNNINNWICAPVSSFAYFGFDNKLMDVIISQGFSKPTAIQMQSVPLLLSGVDVMGLAATGSGKTGAFVWPMISHICGQDEIESGYDGAIGLIMSPTRELASQTYKECKRYVTPFNLRVAPIYGGLNMYQQRKLLKSGVEIIVATPGRLIDLIRDNSTNCRRITYVVIDEVDKMFNLGFEQQIRSILGRIRSSDNKQITMFSATMNDKIERIAADVMNKENSVRIRVGDIHLSNANITQYVEIVRDEKYKFEWLKTRIENFIRNGLVIIFCQSKMKCESLSRDLNNVSILTGVIHGGQLQNHRQETINKFKSGKLNVLVATDVASRGVNIVDIKTVINYDCPHNLDSYIHRVGRTGRADDKTGCAYSLLIPRGENDRKMATQLLDLLTKLRMCVSPQLQQMVNGEFEKKKKRKAVAPAKSSLMNTFVKASNQTMNTKTFHTNTNTMKYDADTHIFDEKHAPPSNTNHAKRKKKNRWGN